MSSPYVGRGSKRAFAEWLRDMAMDSVGNEEVPASVSEAVIRKIERNAKPAPARAVRPWRTVNE